ncbi:Pentatricopeptide repeat-containing protein [Platanthera zijinensis]|uniref:Pentatricopeptide repeat-containing protein n=1 Tax=Platanthera zijinensis TaxID=2320716 RepID=A0AAP0FZS7_9ASPA
MSDASGQRSHDLAAESSKGIEVERLEDSPLEQKQQAKQGTGQQVAANRARRQAQEQRGRAHRGQRQGEKEIARIGRKQAKQAARTGRAHRIRRKGSSPLIPSVDAPSTAATVAARTFPFSSQAPAPSDKHRRPTPPQPCQSNSTSSAAISNTADAADLLNLASSSLSQLRRTHAHLLRRNALFHNGDSIPSLLFSLYASLSSPSSAFSVVASATNSSIYLFNRAIRTLSKSRLALRLYARMPAVAVAPDNFTFPFALNTCAALSDLPTGAELHSRLLRTGFAGHLPVANALIDMYGKCAQLPLAGRVFDEMPLRDLVSNNAILGAHARLGQGMFFARKVFDAMPERNIISWNAMIVGYMNVGNLAAARAVFDAIPARNPVSWMVMILGCCKNGHVDAARQLFDEMPQRNVVSWTVIITGYSQSGRAKEALALFHDMQRAGVQADAATMTCVISAVAQLGSAELACWAGAYVDQNGIDRNAKVLTALVDMYAKCGEMKRAIRHFREIPSPDAFSYTVLINALASNGHCLEALEAFERMLAEAIRPDPITFIGVLSACGHEGLVEDGLRYWHSMAEHGINPCADHYSCVIDMLGRAGRLDEANEMMMRIPGGAHVGALGAMLSACRTYGNVEIGEDVARKLFVLEPDNTGNYVLLSSIYAEKGLWDEARRDELVDCFSTGVRNSLAGFRCFDCEDYSVEFRPRYFTHDHAFFENLEGWDDSDSELLGQGLRARLIKAQVIHNENNGERKCTRFSSLQSSLRKTTSTYFADSSLNLGAITLHGPHLHHSRELGGKKELSANLAKRD